MNQQLRSNEYPLRRREVVKTLMAIDAKVLLVAGLGATTWDVTAVEDRALTFPLWGAMGGAVMIGLGLALAQPQQRVLVLTGDGEMLMGLGSLATVAVKAPTNLSIAVIDNERYGETGMQVTHTAHDVDIAAVAAAVGFSHTKTVFEQAELDQAVALLYQSNGPLLLNIKVRAEELPLALPPKDGAFLKDRFRLALLGEQAAHGS